MGLQPHDNTHEGFRVIWPLVSHTRAGTREPSRGCPADPGRSTASKICEWHRVPQGHRRSCTP
eukprot:5636220-Pyramimonas_sp.AAC.1